VYFYLYSYVCVFLCVFVCFSMDIIMSEIKRWMDGWMDLSQMSILSVDLSHQYRRFRYRFFRYFDMISVATKISVILDTS